MSSMCKVPAVRSHSSMDIRAIIEFFIAKWRDNTLVQTGVILDLLCDNKYEAKVVV